MSNSFQASHGRSRGVCPTLLLSALILIGTPPSGQAHEVLGTFVQHGVHLTVGAQHMDVTLDLTFFEEWSTREREVMDADASGNITKAELKSYLRKLAPQFSRQVKLRVAGRELPLVPLYDPEVDLLANDKVGPAHHRLLLFFFVPTPSLRAGDEIVIEDSLWPEAKALATPQAEGCDGCTLRPEIPVEAGLAPARPEEARSFKFRCLNSPAKPVPRKAQPASSAGQASKSSVSPQPPRPSAPGSVP